MASIRKKGKGYEVRVTNGYDSQGRVRTISRMFMPKETWSGILQLNKPIMRYRPNKACFFNVKFFVLYYSILWYFL